MGLCQIYKCMLTFLLVMVYFISQSNMANTEIDQDHLTLYPYCGRLSGEDPMAASSRITNSRDSRREYPWVVYVKRMNVRKAKKKLGKLICSGSVITTRY